MRGQMTYTYHRRPVVCGVYLGPVLDAGEDRDSVS